MSSINARLSWDRLVDDNKQRIDSFRTQNALATNRKSLVQAFASNCEGKPTSKLELAVWKSKLATSYEHIGDLVQNAIISSGRIDSLRPKLSPQIWEVGSLLLERTSKYSIRPEDFVDLMEKVNSCVPRLTDLGAWEITQYCNKESLHKPLQKIYTQYMELCLMVIQMLETNSDNDQPLAKHPTVNTKIHEASKAIEEAKTEYQDAEFVATSELRHKWTHTGLHAHRKEPEELPQDRYISIKTRGGGSTSEVDVVRLVQTGKVFIRKKMRKATDPRHGVTEEQFKNEFNIMQKLRHEHIAKVDSWRYEGETHFSLFMEPVADCDLHDYLYQTVQDGYPADRLEVIYTWFGCVMLALEYAHGMVIKHGDIKPSNIVIFNGSPYLIDFGSAKDVSEMEQTSSHNTKVGSLQYRAPNGESSRKADIFSLGCVYSEMLTVAQRKDFRTEYRRYLCDKSGVQMDDFRYNKCLPGIIQWILSFHHNSEDSLARIVVELIMRMIEREPEKRVKACEAVRTLKSKSHFWCNIHCKT